MGRGEAMGKWWAEVGPGERARGDRDWRSAGKQSGDLGHGPQPAIW